MPFTTISGRPTDGDGSCCLVTIGATSWHVVHVSHLFLFVSLILVHFPAEKVLCVERFSTFVVYVFFLLSF